MTRGRMGALAGWAVLLLAAAPARGTTDSGTATGLYLHRASGTVLIVACNLHDETDCTSQAYSLRLRQLSAKADTDAESDLPGVTAVQPLSRRLAKQAGVTLTCERKTELRGTRTKRRRRYRHCVLRQGNLTLLEQRNLSWSRLGLHRVEVKGPPGKASWAVLSLRETRRPGGAFDPETGECIEGCQDEHVEQQVTVLPTPKSIAKASYFELLRKAMPEHLPRAARRANARAMGQYRATNYQTAARAFAIAAQYDPTRAVYLTNQASAQAMMKKPKLALATLEKAAALDLALTQKKMQTDKDFRSLRAHPRFKALLSRSPGRK